jgi:fatty-acyl-CoA synthase
MMPVRSVKMVSTLSAAARRIAAYKIPKHVKIVDSFPLTITGKIQKFKMREMTIKELGQETAARIETA